MYVPLIVKKQIQDLDIAKGELFTITKAEEKSGTRRTVKWLVNPSDARAAIAPAKGNATSRKSDEWNSSLVNPCKRQREYATARWGAEKVFL